MIYKLRTGFHDRFFIQDIVTLIIIMFLPDAGNQLKVF
jgi:hypothetical protein